MAPSPSKRKDRAEEKSKDRSKDKGGTKESDKDRGRDKARKRRSASSGSSSTRSRSSSTSSSGSSTSTGSSSGSSSSSASSRSGSSSTSRSSSSSSSSGSPSPSRRRHDNRRRSRSKSKLPKRDEKERKRRSPSPKPTKVHIGRLTRNVTKDHIMEIFSTYGKIKMIDMPVERMHPHLSKGYAYVEFESPDEAEKALKHMDGGKCRPQPPTCWIHLGSPPRCLGGSRQETDGARCCVGEPGEAARLPCVDQSIGGPLRRAEQTGIWVCPSRRGGPRVRSRTRPSPVAAHLTGRPPPFLVDRTNRRSRDHGHGRVGPVAEAPPKALQPPEEDAATAPHVASLPPTDEEKVRARPARGRGLTACLPVPGPTDVLLPFSPRPGPVLRDAGPPCAAGPAPRAADATAAAPARTRPGDGRDVPALPSRPSGPSTE
uniref:RNA-binding protein with serine-rich domain 1 n=1 Tax=Ornithorhynchus anatinus TaxID=9258 RepID=A0A6I8PA97_ORNAN